MKRKTRKRARGGERQSKQWPAATNSEDRIFGPSPQRSIGFLKARTPGTLSPSSEHAVFTSLRFALFYVRVPRKDPRNDGPAIKAIPTPEVTR